MKNQIILNLVVITIFCATISKAQWTPDPFCPYPSDQVTRYPYYGNCSVFWECYEGTKYVMECPEGLEFNAPLEQCDTPSIARCDPYAPTTSNPSPPTWTTLSTTPHETGPNCPFPSNELTFLPYPGNCTLYWECFEGEAYLYQCPDNLWWHQQIENCDYPGSYCEYEPPTTHHGQPTCSGTGSTPEFYPYDGDCSHYWECINGVAYLGGCPPGLWWHHEITECDVPGSYCSNEQTTQPNHGQPSCAGTGAGPVFFEYEGNCTLYWECASEELYLGQCSPGLWWHQSITECDSPGDYCSYSPTTQNPSNITCPVPNDNPVYWPYPGDCTRFWECFEGVKYVNECPPGLWWHQEVERCDEPDTSFCPQ